MKINHKFVGYYYGHPVITDSVAYSEEETLREDYMQALKDFQKHNLKTLPTIELDNGTECYAISVYFDSNEIALLVTSLVMMQQENVKMCWNDYDGDDVVVYYVLPMDADDEEVFSEIADWMELFSEI